MKPLEQELNFTIMTTQKCKWCGKPVPEEIWKALEFCCPDCWKNQRQHEHTR